MIYGALLLLFLLSLRLVLDVVMVSAHGAQCVGAGRVGLGVQD